MSNVIFTLFSSFNIKLDTNTIKKMDKLVTLFEIRDSNPLTLNSNLIGVYPIAFTTYDRDSLFSLFKISENTINTYMKNALIDYKDTKVNISDRKVASDAFNLLSVWLLHLGMTTINNKNERHRFCLNVAKYLHYRYFTSCINNSFRYGADEEVMLAVMEDLSRKFDIVNHGTWKQDIELSCETLLSDKSKHKDTLEYPTDDNAYLYVITDTQTLLRSKLVNIAELYYQYHKQDKRVSTTSSTGTDGEGDKYIIEKISVFNSVQNQVISDLTVLGNFVDDRIVKAVSSQFNNMNMYMFRKFLTFIVNKASNQLESNTYDNTSKLKNDEICYIGLRVLVREIIISSFRFIINENISLNNRVLIWKKIKNLYSSSRTTNKDVSNIKLSVMKLIEESGLSNRDSTKATMRLSFVMYIIYLCLIKIK